MSSGVNDGPPRNTGTLPKSNRRSDRNRERSAANQQMANRSAYHSHEPQHSNNLFQLDWQLVSERGPLRTTKNSNTRSVSSLPSTSYQEITEFVSHSGRRHCNYSTEDCTPWSKMVLPADSQTQSPPCLQGTKPSNVDKMPDRNQVESRLNQIRDYIGVTSTMMDSLSQSSDPNGDSGKEDGEENTETNREIILRRKMEESQRKLVQLQEYHANLVGMQLRVRERLNEARQAQQALLQQENQDAGTSTWEGNNRMPVPLPSNVEELQSETAVLRGKLTQLQTKKKHMDHLLAELQVVEMSDRASCSSDGSRNASRDKAAELEVMKAQLNHLKALMEEATRVRECLDSTSEPEPDLDVNGEGREENESLEEGASLCSASNTSENHIDNDDVTREKSRNSRHRPTVEEVQAVTRELKEQSALLQATRAELQRLKQPLIASTVHSPPVSIFPGSTPPPSLIGVNTEKKQSNNLGDNQPVQTKRRQIEDFVKKDQGQVSSVNRNVGGSDLNSHRSSSSRISHRSTPTNVWPATAAAAAATGGSNEQSIDEMLDNLMDIGPQATTMENGFSGNYWGYPPLPMNQSQHGSAEHYHNLVLNSQVQQLQVQQLQVMGTTIQQCCQLLWVQQRELQSMRTAITQLQLQLRQSQGVQRSNNSENQEDYSNLSRSVHHLADTLDAALPPSSSLPNLVSLPNTSPALSHSVVGTNSQQHQQQQLNNQVPPGNRANNYWDNFRSYSRQNLLSGSAKTITDSTTASISNSTTSANTASGVVHPSLGKDKRNREQGADNLPLPSLTIAETQYSLNLQQQSNLQQQERENTTMRSNIITNEVSQVDNSGEEAHSSFRLPHATNDEYFLHNLSPEMREVIRSLVVANKKRPDNLLTILKEITAISDDKRLPLLLISLRFLQDTQPQQNAQNEAADQTGSDSCRSSDEDSDVGAILGFNMENQCSLNGLVVSTHAGPSSSPTAQVPLLDRLEMPTSSCLDNDNATGSASALKPGCNEDLAEADQSRSESSVNQQIHHNEENEQIQDDVALSLGAAIGTLEAALAESDEDETTTKDEHGRGKLTAKRHRRCY
ncbi:PREDICTED: serine-rich adhesin for platelets isoform X2 [Polistes canadensis]|uniref:serine-rich adhesin for platelets isoform X2 n=1 Tax=Polistes canadensis TaxID=91411 RepID=UPI000718AEC8|nr:PREDICTED: serine-rich adhesin for platelets isoform X2 [Polistes canadensis]